MNKNIDDLLKAVLYRRECPDTAILNDFQMGTLAEPARQDVAAHLARCPHCQAEVNRLVDFLGQEKPAASTDSGWVQKAGFEWRRLHETGQVMIRLLGAALSPPPPQPLPLAVKGHTLDTGETDILRHIALGPDQVDDLDMEAIVRQGHDDSGQCTLVVRVQIPSRWPEFAGTLVRVSAGDWRAEERTDQDGIVSFDGIPQALLDQLTIETQP
jgi:hypothetical protein